MTDAELTESAAEAAQTAVPAASTVPAGADLQREETVPAAAAEAAETVAAAAKKVAKAAVHAKPRKRRTALKGALAGCAAFVLALIILQIALPGQSSVDKGMNCGYVYSGAKSSSVAFNLAADADDSYLLFGSSELSTSAKAVPEVPAAIFADYDFGLDLTYVGEAFDQSLWQAIALGAYAPAYDKDRVVLIVSPGWFTNGGMDNETFGLRFSYSLYREFCDNDAISEASKAYVIQRLAEQGIDEATIQAGLRTAPQDYLNDLVFAAKDDLSLRRDLKEVRAKGIDTSQKEKAPDFDTLRAWALEDAKSASTNDWGIQDAYYEKNIVPEMDRLKGLHADETYLNTPEYNDFIFFLKIAQETGLKPLIVISPVQGDFYDLEGISESTREGCYERIRAICERYGVDYADFSGSEYEKYFLCDGVHFGWLGWVAVEEAIYDFVNEN